MPAVRSVDPREAPQALAIESEVEALRWVGSTTSSWQEEQGCWTPRGLCVAAEVKEGNMWNTWRGGGE